jgi:hypothetical protein
MLKYKLYGILGLAAIVCLVGSHTYVWFKSAEIERTKHKIEVLEKDNGVLKDGIKTKKQNSRIYNSAQSPSYFGDRLLKGSV